MTLCLAFSLSGRKKKQKRIQDASCFSIQIVRFLNPEQIFSFPFGRKEGKEKIATQCIQKQTNRAAPVRCLQDACQLRWQRLAASNKPRHNLHTPFFCYLPTNSVEEPLLIPFTFLKIGYVPIFL